MKICYLADINNYHTKKWCDYFISAGHEVIVISLTRGEIIGCKSYCFDFEDVKKLNTLNKIEYLKTLKKIKDILRIEKPDILHSHYASSYGLLGVLSGYTPHVTSLWGSDIYLFPRKSFVHKFVIKKVLNSNTHIFSTSICMQEEAKKYIKKEKVVHLTPFGVDLKVFQPKESITNKKFVIGINKSLEKISGIDLLLKAISQLLKDNIIDDVELRIAGKGSQYEHLVKLAKELKIENKVRFYGFLDQQGIVSFLQNLDLAVYPSLSESFGVAAVEAQACGVPIVASDVDGFFESTIPGETALLFKCGNINDLKNKIQFLLRNNDKRIAMRIKGPEYIKNNFNISNNFREVYKLYCDIACKS